MQVSQVKELGSVPFPDFIAERVYMQKFLQKDGLPVGLKRWQATVDAMLDGIETNGPIFIMIDQKKVEAGRTQRVPGLHIEGYWREDLHAHSGGKHVSGDDGWVGQDFSKSELTILVSNIVGCRAFEGTYEGQIRERGNCGHIDVSGLKEVIMQAGVAYAGNVTMLHEGLPMAADCERTLVRLTLPGVSLQ